MVTAQQCATGLPLRGIRGHRSPEIGQIPGRHALPGDICRKQAAADRPLANIVKGARSEEFADNPQYGV